MQISKVLDDLKNDNELTQRRIHEESIRERDILIRNIEKSREALKLQVASSRQSPTSEPTNKSQPKLQIKTTQDESTPQFDRESSVDIDIPENGIGINDNKIGFPLTTPKMIEFQRSPRILIPHTHHNPTHSNSMLNKELSDFKQTPASHKNELHSLLEQKIKMKLDSEVPNTEEDKKTFLVKEGDNFKPSFFLRTDAFSEIKSERGSLQNENYQLKERIREIFQSQLMLNKVCFYFNELILEI